MQEFWRELRVNVPGAELAGSLCTPVGKLRSVILMLPGSGRSTRDNEGYFQDLRTDLVGAGHAVAAFDKRGAGQSTGSYYDSTIETQCADAAAWLAAAGDAQPGIPQGVFGHSQGGWVAFEAGAALDSLSFVISSSGPAVGPAPQERARHLHQVEPERRDEFADAFDRLVVAANEARPYEQVLPLFRELAPFIDNMEELLRDGPPAWKLESALFSYDPTPALKQLRTPTLVLHGANDTTIPVDDSIRALAKIGNANIESAIIPETGHRMDGQKYRSTVARFIDHWLD